MIRRIRVEGLAPAHGHDCFSERGFSACLVRAHDSRRVGRRSGRSRGWIRCPPSARSRCASIILKERCIIRESACIGAAGSALILRWRRAPARRAHSSDGESWGETQFQRHWLSYSSWAAPPPPRLVRRAARCRGTGTCLKMPSRPRAVPRSVGTLRRRERDAAHAGPFSPVCRPVPYRRCSMSNRRARHFPFLTAPPAEGPRAEVVLDGSLLPSLLVCAA